jgi:hypothetical protein
MHLILAFELGTILLAENDYITVMQQKNHNTCACKNQALESGTICCFWVLPLIFICCVFICFVVCLTDKQQKSQKVLEKFMGGKFKIENILSIMWLFPLNWQDCHYSILAVKIVWS